MKGDRKRLWLKKAGYRIEIEMIGEKETIPFEIIYSPLGGYVGTLDWAYKLYKWNILPELMDDESKVCSIGFNEIDQKWYGWSHRAMCGFGVGSSVSRGDCAYSSDNVDELFDELKEWNDEGLLEKLSDGVKIKAEMVEFLETKDPDGPLMAIPAGYECHTIHIGKGEWTAKNLTDAKQMAMDFAESVS